MTKQKLQNLLHGMLIGLGIHEPTVPTSAYTDLRAEFFGTYKRINRLAQPRARYREELAKRKSEPTNSIPTECRKAQPVSDQTFYLPGQIFNFSQSILFQTTVFPDTSDNYRVQYEPTQYQAATISSSNKLQQVASNMPSSCHQEMSTKLSATLSFEKEFQQIPKSPKKVTAKVSTKTSTKITKKTVLTSQQIRSKEYQGKVSITHSFLIRSPIRVEEITLKRNRPITIGRKALLISDFICGRPISSRTVEESEESTYDVIRGRVQVW